MTESWLAMQIDDVSVRVQHDRNISRIKQPMPQAMVQSGQGVGGMKDTARTSVLARVAAEALRQLHEDDTVREDKVAKFKFLGADDVKLPDDALDTIFARMFAL